MRRRDKVPPTHIACLTLIVGGEQGESTRRSGEVSVQFSVNNVLVQEVEVGILYETGGVKLSEQQGAGTL